METWDFYSYLVIVIVLTLEVSKISLSVFQLTQNKRTIRSYVTVSKSSARFVIGMRLFRNFKVHIFYITENKPKIVNNNILKLYNSKIIWINYYAILSNETSMANGNKWNFCIAHLGIGKFLKKTNKKESIFFRGKFS